MLTGMFRRSRPAVLTVERIVPVSTGLGQLVTVDVPTDLLLACAWSAVGLAASMALAVAFPLADPVATLAALG